MDEHSAELKRAGDLMQGQWDTPRIERTLRSAKRRRVRRLVTRSVVATACVGIALFAFMRVEHAPSPVATEAPTPEVKAPVVAERLDAVPESTVRPAEPVEVPALEVAEPVDTKTDDADVRARKHRVQLATTGKSEPRADWRVRMRKGDAKGAYAMLKAEQPVLSTLDDLMLAADAARRAGNPRAAVVYLEQALREHSGPRSAVVAFTLGRILRDELRDPGKAALAFMKVQTSQDAPLMADALAREVEAWEASGAHERAKQRAKVYLQRYPTGERRAWMDRLLQKP